MKILSKKPLVILVIVLVLFLGIDIFLGWRWFKLKPKIKTVSLVPGYQLAVADSKQLNSFLKEVGFWQENAIADIRNPSQKTTPKSLIISLVPEVEDYWWRQATDKKEMVAAVGSRVTDKREAKIDFFVWDKILVDENSRNSRASGLLIRGVYGLIHQGKGEMMDDFVKTFYQKYPNLLKITNE